MNGVSPQKNKASPKSPKVITTGQQSQAGETATVNEDDFSDTSIDLNGCASLDIAGANQASNGFNFHQVESGQEIKEGKPVKASHELLTKFDQSLIPHAPCLDTIKEEENKMRKQQSVPCVQTQMVPANLIAKSNTDRKMEQKTRKTQDVQIKKKRPVSHYVKNKKDDTKAKQIITFVNEYGTLPAVDSTQAKLTTKTSYKSLRQERDAAQTEPK